MDSCYTNDPVIRTNLCLSTASYKSSSRFVARTREKEKDTRSLDFYNRAANKKFGGRRFARFRLRSRSDIVAADPRGYSAS